MSARPPGVTSGDPYMTPIFSRSWLMKMAMVRDFDSVPGQLAQGLGHQAGLQADVGVAHLPLDLRPGGEGGHRVDDQHVERSRPDQHVGDLEGLLAGVGLGDQQVVDVDADGLGVDRVHGVLGVDVGADAAVALGLGHHVHGQGRLARGLRTEDLDDPAPGEAADAEGEVEGQSAPVGMASMFMWRFSPMRMIDPLPNCFSICPRAMSSALSRSMSSSLLGAVAHLTVPTLRRGCDTSSGGSGTRSGADHYGLLLRRRDHSRPERMFDDGSSRTPRQGAARRRTTGPHGRPGVHRSGRTPSTSGRSVRSSLARQCPTISTTSRIDSGGAPDGSVRAPGPPVLSRQELRQQAERDGGSRAWWYVLGALGVVLIGVVVAVVATQGNKADAGQGGGRHHHRPPAPAPTCPLTGTPAPGGTVPARPALGVKIGNYPDDRPSSGLNQADIVFEEPVEGAITRLVAVFQCQTRPAGRRPPLGPAARRRHPVPAVQPAVRPRRRDRPGHRPACRRRP